MQSTEPYSILLDARPCRVAFLLPHGDADLFDDTVEYCRTLWGGRFHPILLTDGAALSEEEWTLLRDFDPDVVKCCLTISDALLRDLRTKLTTLNVETPRAPGDGPRLHDEPLRVVPNSAAVRAAGRDLFQNESHLVLFSVAATAPAPVRQFVERNFGRLTSRRADIVEAAALREVQTRPFEVDSIESLDRALEQLSDYRRVVFAPQLCAVMDAVREPRHRFTGEHFGVVVGDTLADLAFQWNRIAATPRWIRQGFSQLWLPAEFARDPSLLPSLPKFLRRYVDSTGNQDGKGALFQSASVDLTELVAIMTRLGGKRDFRAHAEAVNVLPTFEAWPSEAIPMSDANSTERFRGTLSEEHITPRTPDTGGARAGDTWMVDVRIEFRSRGGGLIWGSPRWWQFPLRNDVLKTLRLFNKPARVSRSRLPSLQLRRRSQLTNPTGVLEVRPPNADTLVVALLCPPALDERGAPTSKRVYFNAAPSDKGNALDGVLRIFPTLSHAELFLGNRYWRTAVAEMANAREAVDAAARTQLTNTVTKRMEDWRTADRIARGTEHLVDQLLDLVKKQSLEPRQFTLDWLVKLAQKEVAAHNAANLHPPIDEAHENLKSSLCTAIKSSLDTLLADGAVHVGIKPKCPGCGFRVHWYSLGDAAQELSCRGCGQRYTIRADEPWQYQLNSLLAAAVAQHGTVPVLLVLSHLAMRTQGSFFFAGPTELHSEVEGGYSVDGDVDIVCLSDGELVIGEVKSTVGLFSEKVFQKMLEVARRIRPDRLVFASGDRKSSPLVERELLGLRTELAPLGVTVEWVRLDDHYFEPGVQSLLGWFPPAHT